MKEGHVRPTEPGWYWWRDDGLWDWQVVQVWECNAELYVWFPTEDVVPVRRVAGQFVGPIEEPED